MSIGSDHMLATAEAKADKLAADLKASLAAGEHLAATVVALTARAELAEKRLQEMSDDLGVFLKCFRGLRVSAARILDVVHAKHFTGADEEGECCEALEELREAVGRDPWNIPKPSARADWKALCYEADVGGMRWKEQAEKAEADLERAREESDFFGAAYADLCDVILEGITLSEDETPSATEREAVFNHRRKVYDAAVAVKALASANDIASSLRRSALFEEAAQAVEAFEADPCPVHVNAAAAIRAMKGGAE